MYRNFPTANFPATMSRFLLLVCFFLLIVSASAHSGHDDDEGHSTVEDVDLPARPLILAKMWCWITIFVPTFLAVVSSYFLKHNEVFRVSSLFVAVAFFNGDVRVSFEDLTTRKYTFAFMLTCAAYLLTMVADCIISYVYGSGNAAGLDGADLLLEGGVEQVKIDDDGVTSTIEYQAHDRTKTEFLYHFVATTPSFGDNILLILGLCFQSVLEGIAIGVARTKADVWKALFVIFVHKIVAAFSIGSAFLRMIPNRPLLSCGAYAFAFAMPNPLGVAIGIIIEATTQGTTTGWIFAFSIGIACGVFTYISTIHSLCLGKPYFKSFARAFGIFIISINTIVAYMIRS